MSSLNKKTPAMPYSIHSKDIVLTHGGAPVKKIDDAEELLRRSVLTCLLWEDAHYESGESIAQRIQRLIPSITPERVAEIALEARSTMKLRHVPLLIAREMARINSHKHLVSKLLPEIIQRPDEMTEFLAIYWADGKDQPLSAQVKKGLAQAFVKFNEYNLSKYKQEGKDITLRDVLFLCHAKPKTGISGYTIKARKQNRLCPKDEGSQLFKRVTTKTLKTPDTWEVELSSEGNNKESWERLLREEKLGDLALIRNLRNMEQVNVNCDLISNAIRRMKGDRLLPFRYIAAAKHAPRFEPDLETALFKSLENKPKLLGKTIIIVDVSGSMYGTPVSTKSEMNRADAACALAMLCRELCENPVIYATAGDDNTVIHKTTIVPARRGFALSQAIFQMTGPLGGGGIFLRQVMDYVKKHENSADRIIVITDEQDCDTNKSPDMADTFGAYNYLINVNTYEHGIAYSKKWMHINGWSEAILDYIRVYEEGYNKPAKIFTKQGSPSNCKNQPPKFIKINKGKRKHAKSRT